MEEFNEIFELFTKKKIFGFGKPNYHDYLTIISMLKTDSGENDEKIIEIYEKMPKPTFDEKQEHEEYTELEIKQFESLQNICNEIKPLAEKLEKNEISEQTSFLLNESKSFLKSISN